MTIIRNPTEDERKDFVPIADQRGVIKNPRAQFENELALEQQKAMKKGLPFATHAARDDYLEYERNKELQVKRTGYLPKDYAKFKPDWSKYSDLKNFVKISEDERYDESLSKRDNTEVYLKTVKYHFKGYDRFKYIVMEDPFSARRRARRIKEA